MFGTCFALEVWAAVKLIGFYFIPIFLPSRDLLHYFLALIVTHNNALFTVICKCNDCVAIYVAFHVVSRNPDLSVVRERFNIDFNRAGISPIQWHWPLFHTAWELLCNSLYLNFQRLKVVRSLPALKLVKSWGGSVSAWGGRWRRVIGTSSVP